MALVGSSGSGKSTVIALLERYYDPAAGSVLIDGVSIKDIQLRWLRMQIGLVSQEPSLFATSIKENIMFGKDGALMDEIIAASKAANAHKFISALPQGYETQVNPRKLFLLKLTTISRSWELLISCVCNFSRWLPPELPLTAMCVLLINCEENVLCDVSKAAKWLHKYFQFCRNAIDMGSYVIALS